MAKYTVITLDEMDRFLKSAYKAMRPQKVMTSQGEVTYHLSLDPFDPNESTPVNVTVKIYTSIFPGTEKGAPAGTDAIRVGLFAAPPKDRPLLSGPLQSVHRVAGWRTNLGAKINEMIELYCDREQYWESAAARR